MKLIYTVIFLFVTAFVSGTAASENNPVNQVQKNRMTTTVAYSEQVRKHLQEFEKKKDLKDLETALSNAIAGLPAEGKEHGPEVTRNLLLIVRVIEQEIDPNLEQKAPPLTQVLPPVEAGFPAGTAIDPAKITDSAIRRKYEKSIAENERRRAHFRRQHALLRLLEETETIIFGHVKQTYYSDQRRRADLIKQSKEMGLSAKFVEKLAQELNN